MQVLSQASYGQPSYPYDYWYWQSSPQYRSSCGMWERGLVCYPYMNHSNYYPDRSSLSDQRLILQDYGREPLVINIEQAAEQNTAYRTALWTGKHFQVTLMCIPAGGDIGLEVHPATDQFIRVEEGQGLVQMGDSKDNLDYQAQASEGYAIMIPAGKWHNVTNTGREPLQVYVIYAPPEHPFGTVHPTKEDAMAAHS